MKWQQPRIHEWCSSSTLKGSECLQSWDLLGQLSGRVPSLWVHKFSVRIPKIKQLLPTKRIFFFFWTCPTHKTFLFSHWYHFGFVLWKWCFYALTASTLSLTRVASQWRNSNPHYFSNSERKRKINWWNGKGKSQCTLHFTNTSTT